MSFRKLLRNILSPALYIGYYLPFRSQLNVTRSDKPLIPGITAVVSMKDEEYTLPFCLQSLIGFADQVVIIDNGSEDASLEKAREFKQQYGEEIEVDIIEMPGALLGDCREAGLAETRYQWHLRWDADMIAHTDGKNDIKKLRTKILNNNRPRTIRLPRLNVQGDFGHKLGKIADKGEPILVWFCKGVKYEEKGKFDLLTVPPYFKVEAEDNYYYLHCAGLKSDANRLHRFHYFTWREWYNQTPQSELPEFMRSLESFKDKRNKFLFGSTNPQKVKFRFGKQYVTLLEKFDIDQYGGFPAVLKEEINHQPRFEVIYDEQNKPLKRIDRLDDEMKEFQPDEEDLNWSEEDFFKKIKNEHFTQYGDA